MSNSVWVAKDKEGKSWVFYDKPVRNEWFGKWVTGFEFNVRKPSKLEELEISRSLKWEDDPVQIPA